MKHFKKYCFLIVFVSIVNVENVLGQLTPYFKNYSISDYGANNKNWDIAGGEDGKIYVANSQGLLEYDGIRWTIWELPNKTIVRSVFVAKDRIYTGSFEEFGYWVRDENGLLNYTSLTQNNKDFVFDQEYWQILAYDGSIYFRSFSKIYQYKDNLIKLVSVNATMISLVIVNNELLLSTLSRGILKIVEDQFEPFLDSEITQGIRITNIVSKGENEYLLATALNGCFVYNGNKIIPWNSEINAILKKHELNDLLQLDNDNLIFGTIKNGSYLTDKNGDIIFQINKEVGLINNTVLNQFVASNNQLWLALDNGLASVDLVGTIKVYNDIKGDVGAVYDIANHNNKLYVGSNTGLYFIDEDQELQFIEGSQGQVWDLQIIEKNLFCGHNNGTYLVNNGDFEKISNVAGGWILKEIPGEKDIVIQGTYTGLVNYKKNSNGWEMKNIEGFKQSSQFLVFEDTYTAWVAHHIKGLTKVTFNNEFDKVLSAISYENKGISSIYGVRIFKIKNEIYFQTGRGWQKYEPLLDTIVDDKFLSKNIGQNSYIISGDNFGEIVIKDGDNIQLRHSLLNEPSEFIPNDYTKQRLVSGFEKVAQINDSTLALGLTDGFMLYSFKKNHKQNVLLKPTIEKLILNNELFPVKSENLVAEFNNNNISITTSSPGSRDYFFEYKLSPNDELWKISYNGSIEFSNLLDNDYDLRIRTSNYKKQHSEIVNFKITILPPWYRSKLGFLLYFFIGSLLWLAIFVLNRRKLVRHQKLLQKQFEKEQNEILQLNEIRNEKELNKIKNETLKNEIKLKSKQLANTAMSLAEKNKVLMQIKRSLFLIRDKFSDAYTFKRLISKIDKSIEHEDEWVLFEYNFNQVHEKFFSELNEFSPSLTKKDLKICAFIKMNLSTKEIAPLLNISIRGVETHRYRLKKKLNVGPDESLIDFFKKFN